MAIFELSGVDYLIKQPKLTISRNLENFEKYYVCVLKFLSNLLFVEKECGQDCSRYELADTCEHVLEGAAIGSPGPFLLISRFYTLIRLN